MYAWHARQRLCMRCVPYFVCNIKLSAFCDPVQVAENLVSNETGSQ